MSLLSVALVGKWNELLYFFCKEEAQESLHLQMISHSALDVIEDRKKRSQQSNTNFDMYFGLLFPTEDYRVYGSYTNTHHKIVLICDSIGVEYIGIKECMSALAAAFIFAAQNPFQEAEKPLKSKRLYALIQQIVSKQNSLNQKGSRS